MNYTIESRGDCIYCGGTARCADCDGTGDNGEVGKEEACVICDGSGACQECIDGVERWLIDGGRASCLTRAEAIAFIDHGTIPDWWITYHGESHL